MPYSSTYPISQYRVTTEQYAYLKAVSHGLSKADYKLLCHIFVSTISQYRQINENNNGWLPIPKQFIQAKFRTSDPSNLECLNLIEISRSYTKGKYPRRYRLKNHILDDFIQAGFSNSGADKRLVSIVTGRPSKPETQTKMLSETHIPTLIQASIDMFRVCYFNRASAIEHLNQLQSTYIQAPNDRNRFRFFNDWLIFDAIDKLAEPTNKLGIYSFIPSYTMQNTGRISTPLQSATRAMKAAAYSSIEDLHNYDLASSQMALLLHQFELYRIPCSWLEGYINDPTRRLEYARTVGVTVDIWKKCLYTILMTGHIPTNIKWKDSPVVEALEKEIHDPIELVAALGRLRKLLSPLIKSLKLWHKIIESQAKQEGKVSNMFGIERPASDFKNTAGIVAHLLQGSEAYFIHLLTVFSWKYGFKPISNEHDGLITLGKISYEAQQKVRELTGLHCLELREKPFA